MDRIFDWNTFEIKIKKKNNKLFNWRAKQEIRSIVDLGVFGFVSTDIKTGFLILSSMVDLGGRGGKSIFILIWKSINHVKGNQGADDGPCHILGIYSQRIQLECGVMVSVLISTGLPWTVTSFFFVRSLFIWRWPQLLHIYKREFIIFRQIIHILWYQYINNYLIILIINHYSNETVMSLELYTDLKVNERCKVGFISTKLAHEELVAIVARQREKEL